MKVNDLIQGKKLDMEQKKAIRKCFEVMNRDLFNNELPECIVTYMAGSPRAYGHFQPYSYLVKNGKKKVISEIFLNVTYFDRDDVKVLSTLLHEMVHLAQFHHGTLPKTPYHNRDFADRMLAVGLIPSDTGKEGGKQTGQSVSHYVEPGGRFDKLYKSKLKNYKILYRTAFGGLAGGGSSGTEILKGLTGKLKKEIEGEIDRKSKRAAGKRKVTYKCGCSTVYGKPGLRMKCMGCGDEFEQVTGLDK